MRVWLVRHGKSVANQLRLVTGSTKDPLSEFGAEQVRKTSKWLEGKVFDRYFTSHWERAKQSAQILMPGIHWESDPRLGETEAGDVAEILLKEFLLQWPTFYHSPNNRYPGGESHLDLDRRVTDFFVDLIEKEYRDVLICAHAGPISCILQRVMKIPMSDFPAFVPKNASLSIIELEKMHHSVPLGKLICFSASPSPYDEV